VNANFGIVSLKQMIFFSLWLVFGEEWSNIITGFSFNRETFLTLVENFNLCFFVN